MEELQTVNLIVLGSSPVLSVLYSIFFCNRLIFGNLNLNYISIYKDITEFSKMFRITWGGSLIFETPVLFIVGFIFLFTIGVISGVVLANVGLAIAFHVNQPYKKNNTNYKIWFFFNRLI